DMEVYRADQDPTVCASMCLKYFPDGTGKQFDPASDGGSWPVTQRDACGATPDRVGVRIHGRFHFLSGLIGSGSIDITATSILQLEPTNC
ncbi:MAG TPA: hypothetical protein VFR41_14145, partial [Acidimicrobiia bacterium]|nr:hypothetical protein [Acidimicrobiia bacterium]